MPVTSVNSPSGVWWWMLTPPLEVCLCNRHSILYLCSLEDSDQVSSSLQHYLDWQFLPPESSGILLARFLYVVPCYLLWVSRVRFTVDLGLPDYWIRKELCKMASYSCSCQVPRKENPSESLHPWLQLCTTLSLSPSFYLFLKYLLLSTVLIFWGSLPLSRRADLPKPHQSLPDRPWIPRSLSFILEGTRYSLKLSIYFLHSSLLLFELW